MKKLLMVGTTVAFMFTMGMVAFAANTGKTDGQMGPRAAGCAFVDADGDGICDNCGRYCINNAGEGRFGAGCPACCVNR